MDDLEPKAKLGIKNIVWGALLLAIILIGGLYVFVRYQNEKARQEAIVEYEKAANEFGAQTRENVDFYAESKKLEEVVKKFSSNLPPKDEALAKIKWANSLSEIDRAKGTEILKDVVRDSKYPNEERSYAINHIVDDYELDFIDRNFVKESLFTGDGFASILSESGGDEKLAIRKLNEWSVALSPNVIAILRVAMWYASEIFVHPDMSDLNKKEYLEKINNYVGTADKLYAQYETFMQPQRRGLANELKARVVYLSGGRIKDADALFQKARAMYKIEPINIFQRVYNVRTTLYYVTFLSRNYSSARREDIKKFLVSFEHYLTTSWEPRERNVRLVSLLIAARDSKSLDYPYADFNNKDLVTLRKIHPEFGSAVDKLILSEYVKGHPLEGTIH